MACPVSSPPASASSEALSSLRTQLTSLSGGGVSHRDLGERYRSILDSILTWRETDLVEGLKAFIEAIINENVSLVISRQLLSEVGQHLTKMADDAVSKAVSHYTLDVVQPRVISFEDQVGSIRQHLADIYEREQNWRQAAQVLVGIPLETGQKQYTVDYKLETYLKIARLYLEDDDPTQGEAYINRAAQLQTQTKSPHLQVIYKVRQRRCPLPDVKVPNPMLSCCFLGLPGTGPRLQAQVHRGRVEIQRAELQDHHSRGGEDHCSEERHDLHHTGQRRPTEEQDAGHAIQGREVSRGTTVSCY